MKAVKFGGKLLKLKMRNVEIKAKIRNLSELLSKTETVSDRKCEEIEQCDTFYTIPNGRMKLRKFKDGSSTLIYYERNDITGPKLSSYDMVNIPSGSTEQLNTVLSRALGGIGIVKKLRRLFVVGQTRIHIDSVENLGDFLELEVVLNDEQDVEDGKKIAEQLMKQLGVDEQDLITGAYRDLLENQK